MNVWNFIVKIFECVFIILFRFAWTTARWWFSRLLLLFTFRTFRWFAFWWFTFSRTLPWLRLFFCLNLRTCFLNLFRCLFLFDHNISLHFFFNFLLNLYLRFNIFFNLSLMFLLYRSFLLIYLLFLFLFLFFWEFVF